MNLIVVARVLPILGLAASRQCSPHEYQNAVNHLAADGTLKEALNTSIGKACSLGEHMPGRGERIQPGDESA